jgi:hypothetical protein
MSVSASGISRSASGISDIGSEHGDLFSGEDIEGSDNGDDMSQLGEEINNFGNKEFEIGLVNTNFDNNTKKEIYYAGVYINEGGANDNSIIKIHNSIINNNNKPYFPLYTIIEDDVIYTYEMSNDPINYVDGQPFASFYLFESNSKINDLDNYKVSVDETIPFKYVFPSLTVADIDNILQNNKGLLNNKGLFNKFFTTVTPTNPSPAASGGKRRALSSCGSNSKINAMLQLLFDIEDFKTNIDGLSTNATDNNIKTLSANLKTIFDFINGVGSDEDKNVCPAIESIQTVFDIKNTDDFKTVSTKFYEGMNTYFDLKNHYGFVADNIQYFPYLLNEGANYESIKKYVNTYFKDKQTLFLNSQNYIAIGFFSNSKHKMEISNEISVLDSASMTKSFYLVGYQYLKDDTNTFAYKNIVLNKKFEDNKQERRSPLNIGSDDTKSNFVALYSSTPPSKPFFGGSDSDSDEPHKQVKTKFRVSRRKSRKSKK